LRDDSEEDPPDPVVPLELDASEEPDEPEELDPPGEPFFA
jgi:hypothetical protein